jgi:hypothetical protein
MTLPAIRPGVRWVPPIPGEPDLDPVDLLDPDPADEFDPTEEDREAARMAADLGPEVDPMAGPCPEGYGAAMKRSEEAAVDWLEFTPGAFGEDIG